MATAPFHSAARVVPIILIAYILQTWASIQDIGILVREKTKYITIANFIAAGVAVAGYAILIPLYFEWGAAIATAIAFLVRYVLTYRFSQKLWRVNYDWRPVAILGAWAVAIATIGLLLPQLGILLSLSLRTALVGVFALGVWLLPIMKPDDRDAVRGILRRLVLRKG
jgi:O-antigen/teichoic acid export membrane protein